MNDEAEFKRILDMVENGKISAEEGTRLLDTTRNNGKAAPRICPFCAEAIPAHSVTCPECGSNLKTAATAGRAGSNFQALTGLGKFLVVYTLLVSGIKLLGLLFAFGIGAVSGALLSALGLAAGILILKGRPGGWGLGILWSALQIVCVLVGGQVVNQQIFHLGMTFATNGTGLGINLVGIVLLVLFIKAKPANN